jgi:ABC-type iron transport system FetAB ATPase subunit
MAEDTAVEIVNLSVALAGRTILERFSLAVRSGERVLVSGKSGGGKSTLLRCLLGFVRPAGGEVRIVGQALTGHNVWHLRQHLAYVPQEPDLGAGTMREVFERPFTFRANTSRRANLDRLGEYLDRFGLSRYLLDKDVTSLSGGEKQRAALIVALLLDRDILLLDEPTSALDKASKETLGQLLVSGEAPTTLMVAHDAELRPCAHRVVELPHVSGQGAEP